MPDLGDRSRRIVAQGGNENGDAPRTISLVLDLSIGDALEIARSFLDGALDVLLGHRLGFRRVDRRAQTRIPGRIAASDLGGHRDLTN